MCDAYTLAKPQHIQTDFEATAGAVISWKNDRLFRPGDLAPVLMPDGQVSSLVWGFKRPFFPCLHLAKLTSLNAQPWKLASKRGRCLVPMSTFLEVESKQGYGRTYELSSPEEVLLWAAGIWDVEHRKPRRFALVMVETPVVGFVNQRPAVLNEQEARAYLRGEPDTISLGEIPLKNVELPGALRVE